MGWRVHKGRAGGPTVGELSVGGWKVRGREWGKRVGNVQSQGSGEQLGCAPNMQIFIRLC